MTNKGKMIEAIYAACLTKRATLVIFYLINRANQELTCFPSVGTIASECNMSTRTVQRALNDLEEAGFLERESRFHEKGGRKSNLYHIKIGDVREKELLTIDFQDLQVKKEAESEKSFSADKRNVTTEDTIPKFNEARIFIMTKTKSNLKSIKNAITYIMSWGLRHRVRP